jgi:hypothetical protein
MASGKTHCAVTQPSTFNSQHRYMTPKTRLFPDRAGSNFVVFIRKSLKSDRADLIFNLLDFRACQKLSSAEQEKVFGGTVIEFYP